MSADAMSAGGEADPFEQRLDRIIRTLGFTGRRLVPCEPGWAVLNGHDRRRRPLLHATEEEVRALVSRDKLSLQEGGFHVLAGAEPAPREDRLPIAVLAAHMRKIRTGAGFLGMVRQARAGRGPLSVREATAGLRLASDAEQARRGEQTTMNWDGVPQDKQRRRGRDGGMAVSAREAERRINRLRLAMGRSFVLAWSACVEGLPLAALRARFDLGRRELGRQLAATLRTLADAYDRV
ncbi:MAG TPA: DUF6456 domain-containing protein [Hyphomonadaceae bacterium]|nr:DUF6456 domain-containing protein [Hyphomonadaceae bacterium]